MNVEPTAPTAADQATSAPAPLDPTRHVTAAPVTVGEIAEFLRHLTELRTSGRSDDPAARAAFLHRKAELFTRLAADPTNPAGLPAPERRTP
jgi:hypothetical protein